MSKQITIEDFMAKCEQNFEKVCEDQPSPDYTPGVKFRSRQIKALAMTVVQVLNEMNKGKK
jgi:hypothetical protein